MAGDQQDKKYLVKSQNKITGPFSEQEIQEQLKSGSLSPFASVLAPGQYFWGMLTVYPEFASYIEPSKTITKTVQNTVPFAKQKRGGDDEVGSSSSAQTVPYKVIEGADTNGGKGPPGTNGHATHGPATNQGALSPQKKVLVWGSVLALLMFLIAIGVSGWRVGGPPSSQLLNQTKMTDTGYHWFLAGHYKKALTLWEQSANKVPDLFTFNVLRFQLKNDLSLSESLINSLAEKPDKVALIKALTLLKSGDTAGALKGFKKLAYGPDVPKEVRRSAFANYALLSTKGGDCSFLNTYNEDLIGQTNLIYFLYSACLSQTQTELERASQILQSITRANRNYYQEALLVQMYLDLSQAGIHSQAGINNSAKPLKMATNPNPTGLKQAKKDNLNSLGVIDDPLEGLPFLIEKLLDSNPYLTNLYRYPVWVDRTVFGWPDLLPQCAQIYTARKNHKLFISLYAFCLTRAGLHEQALRMIQKAERMDPRNVLIKSVHAYITDRAMLKSQSALLLGSALAGAVGHSAMLTETDHSTTTTPPDNNSGELKNHQLKNHHAGVFVLPYILQARFCEQSQDWPCVVQNWQMVLRHNPNSISGLSGLAFAKYQQGYIEEAKEYISRGFSLPGNTQQSFLLFVQQK